MQRRTSRRKEEDVKRVKEPPLHDEKGKAAEETKNEKRRDDKVIERGDRKATTENTKRTS